MVSLLLLFAIFMSFDYVALKERKVNLAFKTELEFNKESDVKLIEKIQRYLDQIKEILKYSIAKRKEFTLEKRYTFTDFLNECMNVVKLLKDTETNIILDVLISEFRKFNSNHNMIDINKHASLRKVLKNNDVTSKNIRRKLNNFLLTWETREKGDLILELINSFYKKDSEKKLKKFVNNLYLYKKGKLMDLNQIVKKGIKNILVKHYLNLDEGEKKEVNMLILNILKNTAETKFNTEDTEFYYESSISTQNHVTKSWFPVKFKKLSHSYESDYEHIGRRNIDQNNNFNTQQTQYSKTKNYKSKMNNPGRLTNYLTRITINDDSISVFNNSNKSELDNENVVHDEILAENGVSTVSIAMRKVKEICHKTNDTLILLNSTTKKIETGNKLHNMNSTTDFMNLNKVRTKLKTKEAPEEITKDNNAISSNKEKQPKNTKSDTTTKTFQTNLTNIDNDETNSSETKLFSRFTSTTTSETLSFDFNEFIKKSNYQDGDKAKNKEIEEKMKADLSKLFSDFANNTNNATERPDSFQELEKAFDFD